jgi:hypothetical protein
LIRRAEHPLVAPGESSIVEAHYGRLRPDRPARRARARTPAEREFLALGPVAETFLTSAAAAGVTKLGGEIDQILTLHAAHGTPAGPASGTAALHSPSPILQGSQRPQPSMGGLAGFAPTQRSPSVRQRPW